MAVIEPYVEIPELLGEIASKVERLRLRGVLFFEFRVSSCQVRVRVRVRVALFGRLLVAQSGRHGGDSTYYVRTHRS